MRARKRFDASSPPQTIGPQDGDFVDLGACGVRFLIWGEESGGRFSLVEHPSHRVTWPRRCIATPPRMSTASFWKVAWVRCSAMRLSMRTRATSCSSRAISGTRFGIPATHLAESSRSSRQPASSTGLMIWVRGRDRLKRRMSTTVSRLIPTARTESVRSLACCFRHHLTTERGDPDGRGPLACQVGR